MSYFDEIFKKLEIGKSLEGAQVERFLKGAAEGEVSLSGIKHFLSLLAQKGETEEEILAVVKYIHENASLIGPFEEALDIHGTGGDKSGSFNISSTVIFVVAAAGVTIVKHGNRSSSSASGSADLLEALGVNINLEPRQVEQCVKKVGMGFMFAPKFHKKLEQINLVRKELGIKTIFNKAFPLVSPAGVKNHFIGVTDWELAALFTDVLKKQGCQRFMLARGRDPMDEISVSNPTDLWQFFNGEEKQYAIKPEDFGLTTRKLTEIKGGGASENSEITKRILRNDELGAKRDIILLNSAASLVIAKKVDSWEEGIGLADEIITSGRAFEKLEEFIDYSNTF